MNRLNRRQRVTPKAPKRELGQRMGFRPEARQQFKDDRRLYREDINNNQIYDEMNRRAQSRGQSLEGMSDFENGMLEGQVIAGRAAKKALPYAALGVAVATGAGLAMNNDFGVVGQDPLAQARNNIAQANETLGSERMLDAITRDQIEQAQRQEEAAAQALMIEPANQLQGAFEADVMRVAQDLMTYPDVEPSQAITRATEIVHNDYRARQIY